jgi:hypothetical protein
VVVLAAADGAALLLGAASSLVALLCLLLAWKQLFRYDLTGGQPTTGALQEFDMSRVRNRSRYKRQFSSEI